MSLNSSFVLELNETFVVSSFRWNLVFVSILDKEGYFLLFGDRQCRLFSKNFVGTSILSYMDNLYMLGIVNSTYETFHVSLRGIKWKLTNENSGSLWHKHLGHISKQRIEKLMSNGILDSLDFQTLNSGHGEIFTSI